MVRCLPFRRKKTEVSYCLIPVSKTPNVSLKLDTPISRKNSKLTEIGVVGDVHRPQLTYLFKGLLLRPLSHLVDLLESVLPKIINLRLPRRILYAVGVTLHSLKVLTYALYLVADGPSANSVCWSHAGHYNNLSEKILDTPG